MQTRLGFENGNCWAACVASLTDIPLEIWPEDLMETDKKGRDWYRKANEILDPYGLAYLEVPFPSTRLVPEQRGLFCILVGHSPRCPVISGCFGDPERSYMHAIVGQLDVVKGETKIKCMHDPHPDGKWLEGEPLWIGFLINGRA
jgi:hypothetical protein